jgi:nucleoside 2-deoxyribosyltransferase
MKITTFKVYNLTAALLCFTMLFSVASYGARNPEEETASQTEMVETMEAGSAPGKKVYFAGPLFSQSEKDYNLQLTEVLEDHGYEVFLPQRDGYLASELDGKTEEEKTQMIFMKDVSEVLKADILFMVLDGRVPDEGACVELGIAYANGKRCYGVKTDVRAVENNMDLNPMIAGCFARQFKNSDGNALIEELEQYLSGNEL